MDDAYLYMKIKLSVPAIHSECYSMTIDRIGTEDEDDDEEEDNEHEGGELDNNSTNNCYDY